MVYVGPLRETNCCFPHAQNYINFQMVKVRRMLTEILLAVTDVELQSIAKDVYRKAKQNAAKGSTWGKLLVPHCRKYFLFSPKAGMSAATFKRVVLWENANFSFKVSALFRWVFFFKILHSSNYFPILFHFLLFMAVIFQVLTQIVLKQHLQLIKCILHLDSNFTRTTTFFK